MSNEIQNSLSKRIKQFGAGAMTTILLANGANALPTKEAAAHTMTNAPIVGKNNYIKKDGYTKEFSLQEIENLSSGELTNSDLMVLGLTTATIITDTLLSVIYLFEDTTNKIIQNLKTNPEAKEKLALFQDIKTSKAFINEILTIPEVEAQMSSMSKEEKVAIMTVLSQSLTNIANGDEELESFYKISNIANTLNYQKLEISKEIKKIEARGEYKGRERNVSSLNDENELDQGKLQEHIDYYSNIKKMDEINATKMILTFANIGSIVGYTFNKQSNGDDKIDYDEIRDTLNALSKNQAFQKHLNPCKDKTKTKEMLTRIFSIKEIEEKLKAQGITDEEKKSFIVISSTILRNMANGERALTTVPILDALTLRKAAKSGKMENIEEAFKNLSNSSAKEVIGILGNFLIKNKGINYLSEKQINPVLISSKGER